MPALRKALSCTDTRKGVPLLSPARIETPARISTFWHITPLTSSTKLTHPFLSSILYDIEAHLLAIVPKMFFLENIQ
jgi:hypothetical protein